MGRDMPPAARHPREWPESLLMASTTRAGIPRVPPPCPAAESWALEGQVIEERPERLAGIGAGSRRAGYLLEKRAGAGGAGGRGRAGRGGGTLLRCLAAAGHGSTAPGSRQERTRFHVSTGRWVPMERPSH